MRHEITAFRRLPRRERWLFIEAFALLGLVRLGVRLLSLRSIYRLIDRRRTRSPRSGDAGAHSADRIVRAVKVAGRYVPKATCLAEALTAKILLAHHGHPSELRIGLLRGDDGTVRGHAWLESQGAVLIGQSEDVRRFTPITSPD